MTDAELDLRARFESLREMEQASAPDFQDVVEVKSAARIPTRRSAGAWVGLAAAAGVVVAAAMILQGPSRATSSTDRVTSWQSPTTSLVPTNGQTVLAPPPLLSSVLDDATASTLWRKGD